MSRIRDLGDLWTNFLVRPLRARGWAFNRNFGPIVPKVPNAKNWCL